MDRKCERKPVNPMQHRPRRILAAIAILGAVGLSGCAWWNGNDEREIRNRLSHVTTAVEVADTDETRRYAASEIAIAREKLASARHAANAEDFALADRLISESLVNVQLATAKAEMLRSRAQLKDMKTSPPPEGTRGEGRPQQ